MGDLRTFNRRNANPANPEHRAEPRAPEELRTEQFHGEERRRETRKSIDLPLTVWGVDTKGEQFLQEVRARDISLSGALLSGLDVDLTSGDVIGILHAGRKARYRVIWIRYDESGDKLQAAVHRVAADACPWLNLLADERHVASARTEEGEQPQS
jgi:hypothetical protein